MPAPALALRPFAPRDVAALVAIQHATCGGAAPWSAARLVAALTDPEHDGGRRAIVAERDGAVTGGAGWVPAGATWFGAPVLAADDDAAAALIDALIARARAGGAARLRIGCGDGEPAKAAALAARGFAIVFEFVTLACPAARRDARALAGLVHAPLAAIDPAALRDVHDACFAAVDNVLPIDLAGARHLQAVAWPGASGGWLAPDGALAAYVVAERDDHPVDHVTIAEIAVAPAWQRRGLAGAVVDRVVDAAARAGAAEVHAMIATTNTASLALHRAAGFTERWRRDIFERAP